MKTSSARRVGVVGIAVLIAFMVFVGVAQAAEQKLLAADGAPGDLFGITVAIDGDTVVVGSPFDDLGQGSAYVYVLSGGVWTQQAKLVASDGAAGATFGTSVAISGDTVVVGAPFDNANQGAAYVFVRSGGVWTEQQKLVAADGVAGDQVGWSVSISGDTIVTGAILDSIGLNTAQGSAYVFLRSGTTWTEQAKLVASDGAATDQFGFSVAINGDTAVVGALQHDAGGNADQGAAYVYFRSGTTWTEQAKLTASDGVAEDEFGHSVAVNGDSALIGTPGDESVSLTAGAAYVFVRSGAAWSEQAKLTASDGVAGDLFGWSVAIEADRAIVGAQDAQVGGNVDQGAVYVFDRSGTTWTEQAKLTASDGAGGDAFGYSVGISGGLAVVGAPFDDGDRADPDRGSAYVYDEIVPPVGVHDVGICGPIKEFGEGKGCFNTRSHLKGPCVGSLSTCTFEIKIRVKNFGEHAESSVPYAVTNSGGPERVYSAACSGDAASVSPDGDLDPGETVEIAGCTVTYSSPGVHSHTLTVVHGSSPALDSKPGNNTATRTTIVKGP